VGASAAGLATAACWKNRGLPFELLEAGTQVASAWRNHYQRLHLHTAKGLSQLPFLFR
jgi:cation diffusion facilitator CzcD-associated flavoprotein CzcO